MNKHTINTPESFEKLRSYVLDQKMTPKVRTENRCYILNLDDEEFALEYDQFDKTYQPQLTQWIRELKKSSIPAPVAPSISKPVIRPSFSLKKSVTLPTKPAIPSPTPTLDPDTALIYGKDQTKNIVGMEVKDGSIELFIEKDGQITTEVRENKFWMVSNKPFTQDWKKLQGNLFYRYIKYYDQLDTFQRDRKIYYDADTYSLGDAKEAAMLLNGYTYFKGMKVSDVSILSFDIEATGLTHNRSSRVLIISNTFRSAGKITKKIFSVDNYETDAEMLDDWCTWVREMNPSIISGFNIFGYDIPYMEFCAKKAGTSLNLGRDGSEIRFEPRESKFRKDGSQDYLYKRCHIYGREIVDTMFVAYHFDISRKYERYALKSIIKQEGLAREGRQYYEAQNIGEDWKDISKREMIKTYAQDDADENLALYDLMISAYFYSAPHIPKSFQMINYSATGSQVNSVLVRSYLQEGHSLPKASEAIDFPGAISDGNPGIYKNVFKVDVASLYPSIMLQYEIHDSHKDPKKNFLKMVQYFTKERLADKQKAKETGDRYFKELEQSKKIFINSAYGLLGGRGLLFNSPSNAALVTEKGREILKKAILWASGQEYIEKKKDDEVSEDN